MLVTLSLPAAKIMVYQQRTKTIAAAILEERKPRDMERVETLINKLRTQLEGNASIDQLLVTVQILQSELVHLKSITPQGNAVSGPSPAVHISTNAPSDARLKQQEDSGEKIVEVLQVDEAALEAELEEIRKNAEALNQMGAVNKPPMRFDPMEEAPTLIQHQAKKEQKPQAPPPTIVREEETSLNEKLKQSHTELSDALSETSIKDLRKGIGLNDRFVFINELFRGDEVMYERSIKTINGFAIYPEAEYWIKRELKLKLGWMESNPVVKQFDQLVRRRFS